MNVPYSMDDSEPDLYGSLGGRSNDDDYYETQTKWDGVDRSHYPNIRMEEIKIPVWYTQEQMDKVIQFNINAVRKAYEEGYDDGFEQGHAEGKDNCQHR